MRERADLVADIGAVDLDESTLGPVRGGKADLFQQPFEDCVQAPGADILDRGVDLLGQQRQFVDRLLAFLGEERER